MKVLLTGLFKIGGESLLLFIEINNKAIKVALIIINFSFKTNTLINSLSLLG